MAFDKFKGLIDSIDRSDVFDVYVLGGEPCILPNYLEYLLNNLHNKFIIIVSNLTLVNEKICNLVGNSPNHVEFCATIDGAEKDIHNSTRGLFDKVCRGLDFLREYSIPIRVNSCVTPYNLDKLEDIIKFLIPYNIVTIKFSPVGTNHLAREIVNELDISKNYRELTEHLFELQTKYRQKVNIDIAFDSEMNLNFDRGIKTNKVIYGPCTAGVIKAGININGEIVPCVSTSSKIKIPFNGSFEDAFETLKLEISKSGRKIIEQDNVLRIQNCCQVIGYGKEKPICEIKTI
jgi:sulfatase maturation enzyme AslB (radical SAM superfamily)